MPTGDHIPTEVTNFTWSAFFGLVVAVINGTALGVWLKNRPNMKKLASDERESDFARLRQDVKEAATEAKAATAAAQRLENMVACMRPAISILTAEVRRLDPNSATNAAILQVQELMAMASAGDLGVAQGLMHLATVKGRGE